MRKFLFIIATFVFFSFSAQAEENINECMNDIYFANGINTTQEDAKYQLENIIYIQVLKGSFNSDEEKMNKTVDFKLAYNNTMGIAFDLLEAYGQKKAEHGTFWWTLGTMYDVFGGIAKEGLKEVTSEGLEAIIVETLKNTASQFIVNPLIEEAGLKDLASLMKDLRSGVSPSNVWDTLVDSAAVLENYDSTKQLSSYKNSIKLGHSAIVIAHSQGNLFTNVVYNKIASSPEDKWMTKYFYMIGVASPAGVGTGPTGIEVVTFDNDPITNIPDSIGDPIANPTRSVSWIYEGANPNQTRPFNCLDSNHYANGTVPQSCVESSDPEYSFWSPFDNYSIDFHLFTYYMNTEVSRLKIMNFVDASLKAHTDVDSQWIQNEEFEKNTCNYKITVKHRHDPSIEMGEKVYPFAANKKLYQVNGEWVKASCGGKNILETWAGKKDNECLMIDNVEKEKITEKRQKKYIGQISCSIGSNTYYRPTDWDTGDNSSKQIYCSDSSNTGNNISEYMVYSGPKRSSFDTWEEFNSVSYNFTMENFTPINKIAKGHMNSMINAYKNKLGDIIIEDKSTEMYASSSTGYHGNKLIYHSNDLSFDIECHEDDMIKSLVNSKYNIYAVYTSSCWKIYSLKIYSY